MRNSKIIAGKHSPSDGERATMRVFFKKEAGCSTNLKLAEEVPDAFLLSLPYDVLALAIPSPVQRHDFFDTFSPYFTFGCMQMSGAAFEYKTYSTVSLKSGDRPPLATDWVSTKIFTTHLPDGPFNSVFDAACENVSTVVYQDKSPEERKAQTEVAGEAHGYPVSASNIYGMAFHQIIDAGLTKFEKERAQLILTVSVRDSDTPTVGL